MPKPLGNTGGAKLDKQGHTTSGKHGTDPNKQPAGTRGTPRDLSIKG